MEDCIQFLLLQIKRDIDKLRRVTRMVRALKTMSYENRLKELSIFSAEKRQLRGDIARIVIYKYLRDCHMRRFILGCSEG